MSTGSDREREALDWQVSVWKKARAAVRAAMWPGGDGPRHFSNVTQFIVGTRTV